VLTAAGIKAVDRVIVSHADLDHSGGLPALLEAVTVGSLLSGEVQETGGTPCVYGQVWQWDGVQFEILHPADPSRWEGNDASCVLLVTAGRHRLLLPGDIELSAEQYLAERLDAEPMSVVLVPHHGSKTSSGSRLVEALRPDVALVSAGFGNRWGFPKESVVRRWESVGSALYSTGDAGALRGRYCSYADSGRLWRERIDAPRYWRDPSAIIDGQN
jgi:competence protein ComEC